MRRYTLIVFSSFIAACAGGSDIAVELGATERAVVGGSAASADEIGATIALLEDGLQFCTGTLIAPRVVMTAAHCCYDLDDNVLAPAAVDIAFGVLNADQAPPANVIGVDAVIPHPAFDWNDWDLGTATDVGVLVLSEPAPIAPAPLLDDAGLAASLVADAPLLLSGYGLTNENQANSGGVLFRGLSHFVQQVNNEFAAGDGTDADSCYGDSGGPAYFDLAGVRHLVGVVSRGSGDVCGTGGIYGLVNPFTPWIEEVTDGLFPEIPTVVEEPEEPVEPEEPAGDEPETPDDPVVDEPAEPAPPPPTVDDPEKNPVIEPAGEDVDGRAPPRNDIVILEQNCANAGAPASLWLAFGLLGLWRRRKASMTRGHEHASDPEQQRPR